MKEEKPQEEGYTAPVFIASGLGDKPPVGAWIDKGAVCRNCMKAVEENSMRRGFIDPISAKEAEEKRCICARCGRTIATAS